MKKLNSYLYTEGQFGKYQTIPIIDKEEAYLYSQGYYATKIRAEDLTEDYIKIQSRTLRYYTAYLKTSGVVDIDYTYVKQNHLLKDDYLYISYKEKLRKEKDSDGFEDFVNHDICICGNDVIYLVLAIEKYSNINVDKVKNKIYEKVKWYKENCQDIYKRQFGDKDIDIFEYYKEIAIKQKKHKQLFGK